MEDKKDEEKTRKNFELKPTEVRAISPNYFITSRVPDKFIKGFFYGDKLCLCKFLGKNLDGKIRIYEDRVRGWFLDHARTLIKEQHADFVVLMICTSYLEGNQQFKEGRSTKIGESGEMIKRAVKSIFTIPEEKEWVLDKFVSEVRHGLFHDAMTRELVSINRGLSSPFSITNDFKGAIIINPILFLNMVEEDFKEYIDALKNPANEELRVNFEKHWEERHKIK